MVQGALMLMMHENDLVGELLRPELKLTLSRWSSANGRATRRRRTTAYLLPVYGFIEYASCAWRKGACFERALENRLLQGRVFGFG